jgi:two-component system, OmpR family, phosphate regulon sensor histidine kinase PhoR
MATDSVVPQESAIPSSPAPNVGKSVPIRRFAMLLTFCLIFIAIIAVSFGLIVPAFKGILRAEIERSLTQKAKMFASLVNNDHSRNIRLLTSEEGQLAGARATVVDMNGKVIADSEVQIAGLDSEGRQPEFLAALHGDTGVDTRSRGAFGMPVLYVAVPVPGGAVRLAYPLADLNIAADHAWRILIFACTAATLAAVLISALFARAALRSIAEAKM